MLEACKEKEFMSVNLMLKKTLVDGTEEGSGPGPRIPELRNLHTTSMSVPRLTIPIKIFKTKIKRVNKESRELITYISTFSAWEYS